MSISVIVATLGRPTLSATLESFRGQLRKEDRVFIMADGTGNPDRVLKQFEKYADDNWHFEVVEESNWGTPQRNAALKIIEDGSYITCMDDDDVYTTNAFQYFREWQVGIPVLFRMQYTNGMTLWANKGELICGNFGTPCVLMPKSDKTPNFGLHYAGDADYIIDGAKNFKDMLWRPEVVALIRPHE